MDKPQLRKEIAQRITTMSEQNRRQADAALLKGLDVFLRGNGIAFDVPVMAYMPLADEPDITPCLDWFSNLCLPLMLGDGEMCARAVGDWKRDCVCGRFDVLEPSATLPLVEPEKLQLVIVPGRAFTREGLRMGRGKGYYDRFLAQSTPDCLKVALCYECQIVDNLPQDEHDLPVDQVIIA